jgi:cupin 2 domain-containing protein
MGGYDDTTGVRRGALGATPEPGTGESFAELARLGGVRIEEIVSSATPEPVDYRQAHDEWVVLLAGAATLDVDGERIDLGTGDWVLLPAGTPHRVVRTAAGSRWLAVHVAPQSVAPHSRSGE